MKLFSQQMILQERITTGSRNSLLTLRSDPYCWWKMSHTLCYICFQGCYLSAMWALKVAHSVDARWGALTKEHSCQCVSSGDNREINRVNPGRKAPKSPGPQENVLTVIYGLLQWCFLMLMICWYCSSFRGCLFVSFQIQIIHKLES